MSSSYTPSISEGIYPTDGGWTEANEKDILLLYIPEFGDILENEFIGYDYAWLYDKNLSAYIFCFRLDNGNERAIIFHKEHAGVLILEDMANRPFELAITDTPLEELTEESRYILLSEIELKREESADW